MENNEIAKNRSNLVARRPTEGSFGETSKVRLNAQRSERKRGGRPVGAKNKPKPLIPKELASEFLGVIKEVIPASYYDEMKQAIKEGKSISTVTEAKITLKLMGPAIWRRLMAEGRVNEDGTMSEFSKDLNERLKVYTGLMSFIEKVEGNDEGTSDKEKPIIEIFARRGISSERLNLLVGVQSGGMGGDSDGTGGGTRVVGAFSDIVSERQVNVSDSEQVEADWIFDGSGS